MSTLVQYQTNCVAILYLHCVSRRSPTGECVPLHIHERHHAFLEGLMLACISVIDADEQAMDMWNQGDHTYE
jgi:hypothetical protein